MKFNVEILGLMASGFVLLSFLTTGEKNIRKVNLAGALLFFIYGWKIQALSVWLVNGLLFMIHIYKLLKLKRLEEKTRAN